MIRIDLSDPAAIRRDGAAWPWRIAFLLFAVLLLIATHWPGSGQPANALLSPDKLMHFLCFGGFTFLLWMTGWIRRFWVVTLLSIVFTIIDELSQGFFSAHRDTSGIDIAAGLLGVLAATAWMSTFQSADHFITRQQERRITWMLDELMGRPSNWFLLGAAFSVPMLLLFLPLYLLAWSIFGISIGNIALTIGILVGLAIAWGMLLRILPRYTTVIEENHPCFDCGAKLIELELDENGSGHCSSCGHPVHASQWIRMPVPQIPASAILQADGPVGMACMVCYVALAMFAAPLLLLANGHPGLAAAIFYTGVVIAAAMGWQWYRVLRNGIMEHADQQCIRCDTDLSNVETDGGLGTCPKCNMNFARMHAVVDDEVFEDPDGADASSPTAHD